MLNNYAYIDTQNVNLAVRECGWKLDWKKFYVYLREKYKAKKAYLFMGYLYKHRKLYKKMKIMGYTLMFKEISRISDEIKGNVDAELVLQCATDIQEYNKAIIVTNDGDFACLAKFLYGKNKLQCVLSPNIKKCSVLLKKAAKEKIACLSEFKTRLELK